MLSSGAGVEIDGRTCGRLADLRVAPVAQRRVAGPAGIGWRGCGAGCESRRAKPGQARHRQISSQSLTLLSRAIPRSARSRFPGLPVPGGGFLVVDEAGMVGTRDPRPPLVFNRTRHGEGEALVLPRVPAHAAGDRRGPGLFAAFTRDLRVPG